MDVCVEDEELSDLVDDKISGVVHGGLNYMLYVSLIATPYTPTYQWVKWCGRWRV